MTISSDMLLYYYPAQALNHLPCHTITSPWILNGSGSRHIYRGFSIVVGVYLDEYHIMAHGGKTKSYRDTRINDNFCTPKMLGTLLYSPIGDNFGFEAPQSTRDLLSLMLPCDHTCQSPFPNPFEKHNSVCKYELIINM